MDELARILSGLSIEPITKITVFLDFWFNTYVLFVLITLAILPFFKDKRKILVLFLALVLTMSASSVLKSMTNTPRPCVELPAKVPCPSDPAFPSGHTATAFVFVAASIGESFFLVYFLLGIFIAFSRLYVGVHWFNDVLGGMVIGIVCYVIADRLFQFFVSFYEQKVKKVVKWKE